MTRLPLSYGGEVYDRTAALFYSDVRPQGIDLRYVRTDIEEIFWRQSRYREFDASELSFGVYLATLDTSERPFVAIPVFPSRAFRHSAIYVHDDSPLTDARDLREARIGTPEWTMTASLWMRGILEDYYEVPVASVAWFTGGLDEPGREERVPVGPAPGLDVSPISPDDTLSELLLRGDLDAVIAARPPESVLGGRPGIRRLFADPQQEEIAYFRSSGIVPIMHLVALRREVVEANPWIARNLYDAFVAAKRGVARRLRDSAALATSLIWQTSYAESEQALIGDPFAYGAEPNRAALEAILRYGHEQGLTARRWTIDEIFSPSTLTEAKV